MAFYNKNLEFIDDSALEFKSGEDEIVKKYNELLNKQDFEIKGGFS